VSVDRRAGDRYPRVAVRIAAKMAKTGEGAHPADYGRSPGRLGERGAEGASEALVSSRV
jgi:hypothetical protein